MVLLIDSVFLFERYMCYAVPFFHEVAYQLGSFLRIDVYKRQGYDHAVKLLRLQNVLTKEVEMLIPETEEEFGNDPVLIYKGEDVYKRQVLQSFPKSM